VDEHVDRLRARRAATRAAQARRRRLAALAAVLAAALAVVALASSGGGGHRSSSRAAARPGSRQTRPQPTTPSTTAALRRLAAYGLPVYCAGGRRPLVALTFDDGPGPYTTKAIRKLRKHHARATFFLVGKSIASYPGLARLERQVAAVGDHTMTHPFLPGLAQSPMEHQLSAAKQLIERNARQPVALFRPPYGARTPAIDRAAKALGMVEVIWSVDSGDSAGANYAGIERNVINGMRPGAIILMHENRGQTIRALLTILPALTRKHLRAVTLPELLAQDPPTLAQLRAGGRGCGGR
jgi:peptidoglycan/xylan/chitin deacetylase (PgdA/CDA1 family)